MHQFRPHGFVMQRKYGNIVWPAASFLWSKKRDCGSTEKTRFAFFGEKKYFAFQRPASSCQYHSSIITVALQKDRVLGRKYGNILHSSLLSGLVLVYKYAQYDPKINMVALQKERVLRRKYRNILHRSRQYRQLLTIFQLRRGMDLSILETCQWTPACRAEDCQHNNAP